MATYKGSIRFGAVSGAHDGYVSIEIEDETSGVSFLEIDLSYEQFGKLVGSNGAVKCEFTVRGLDSIGKVREYEKAKVTISNEDYQAIIKGKKYDEQKEALSAWLKSTHKREGWHMSTYLGSRDSITLDYDLNMTTLHYGYFRYVDPT